MSVPPVVLPISGETLREMGPTLRTAYHEGRAIIGSIERDSTGCYLKAATISRVTWKKVRRLLEAEGFPPAV